MLSLDPAGIALVALLVALYVRAVRVLGRRGFRVRRGQQVCWYTGVALIGIGLLGPPERYASELLSLHMVQHLLIADLAAPFLLAGMRNPVMYFLLPRPLLERLARRRRLRAVGRFVRRPLVALAIYVLILYTWHFEFAMDAALRHGSVHALQHESFFIGALIVWWPAIEPARRRLPGELWKVGYILGARVLAMFVGMSLIVSRHAVYQFYAAKGKTHGLTPLSDQQIAGGVMLSVDIVVMMVALAFFFWRASADDQRREAAERAAPVAG